MGLIRRFRISRMKDPVMGSLRVTTCAQPDTTLYASRSYSATVLGVVRGPGIAPTAVEHGCSVPAKRCPTHGQIVPVMVDRAQPDRLVILWERVRLRDPLARARAANRRAAGR